MQPTYHGRNRSYLLGRIKHVDVFYVFGVPYRRAATFDPKKHKITLEKGLRFDGEPLSRDALLTRLSIPVPTRGVCLIGVPVDPTTGENKPGEIYISQLITNITC